MKGRILNTGITLTLCMAWALTIQGSIWWLKPYRIITSSTRNLIVYTPIVSQGGMLEYGTYVCRSSDMQGIVSRTFVDGVRYPTTPVVTVPYPVGCANTRIAIPVPELPPGVYHLETDASYRVNPVRVIQYHWRSGDFLVTPRRHRREESK